MEVSMDGLRRQLLRNYNSLAEKLNEVAVFNSNLAYATRLFTEHTTTKQEKINLLTAPVHRLTTRTTYLIIYLSTDIKTLTYTFSFLAFGRFPNVLYR